MNSEHNMLFLINDAINDTVDNTKIDNTKINKKENTISVQDISFNLQYNFSDTKTDIIKYLNHKKQKLYNKLSRRNYDDYREVLQDIYYFYEFNLKDINNINSDDPFIYRFNEIISNIKYEYNMIKNLL